MQFGLINSWRQSIALSQVRTNIQTKIQKYKDNGGDPIVCIPVFDPSNTGNAPIQDQYVGIAYEVAAEKDCPVFDIRKRHGSNAAAVAAGFQPPGDVHMTAAGYDDMAGAAVPTVKFALAV